MTGTLLVQHKADDFLSNYKAPKTGDPPHILKDGCTDIEKRFGAVVAGVVDSQFQGASAGRYRGHGSRDGRCAGDVGRQRFC